MLSYLFFSVQLSVHSAAYRGTERVKLSFEDGLWHSVGTYCQNYHKYIHSKENSINPTILSCRKRHISPSLSVIPLSLLCVNWDKEQILTRSQGPILRVVSLSCACKHTDCLSSDKHRSSLLCTSSLHTHTHTHAHAHTRDTNTPHIWAMTQSKRLPHQAHHLHLPSSSVCPHLFLLHHSDSAHLSFLVHTGVTQVIDARPPTTSTRRLGLDTKITPSCKERGTQK